MAKQIIDMKEELQRARLDFHVLQRIDCTREENKAYSEMIKNGEPLPAGVYQYRNSATGNYLNSFYTIWDSGLNDAEKGEIIQYQKLYYLKTIKNCLVFFVVMSIIAAIGWLVLLLP